jgi:hypothetical protein
MSGVSITSGPANVDLDSIIKGGDGYMQRVKEFREAQRAADESRANLGLAGNVLALRDEAARLLNVTGTGRRHQE